MGLNKECVKEKIATLLGTSSSDIDDHILQNIEDHKTPEELCNFLASFVCLDSISVGQEINEFVAEYFKTRNALGQKLQNQEDGFCQRDEISEKEDFKIAQKYEHSKKKSYSKKKNISKDTMQPKDDVKRRYCFCQAQYGTHELVGNCLSCGKIACSAEGEGPCLFCGNEIALVGVFVPDPFANNYSDDYHNSDNDEPINIDVTNKKQSAVRSLKEALAHKECLLEYERTNATRAQVFDDSTDWFSEAGNVWLAASDRHIAQQKAIDAAEKRKRYSKHSRYLTFDIGKGEVYCERPVDPRTSEHEDIRKFLTTVKERQSHDASSLDAQAAIFGSATGSYNKVNTFQGKQAPMFHLSTECSAIYDALQNKIGQLGGTLVTDANSKDQQHPQPSWKSNSLQFTNNCHKDLLEAQKKWDVKEMFETNDISDDAEVACNSIQYKRIENKNTTLQFKTYNEDTDSNNNTVPVNWDEPVPSWNDNDDEGVCLSMHQPWASLLIYGFKRIEGRSWSTNYRGRLWIHAASKPVEPAVVEELELIYANLYDRITNNFTFSKSTRITRPSFPTSYPTSCILGCVDMVDCMSQTEYMHYRETTPFGVANSEENNSSFVFICKRPRRLLIPIHMKGEHKLWRLQKDRLVHFQKALREVRWPLIKQSMEHNIEEKSNIKDVTQILCDVDQLSPQTLIPDRGSVELSLAVINSWFEENGETLKQPIHNVREGILVIKSLLTHTLQECLTVYILDKIETADWIKGNHSNSSLCTALIDLSDSKLSVLKEITFRIFQYKVNELCKVSNGETNRQSCGPGDLDIVSLLQALERNVFSCHALCIWNVLQNKEPICHTTSSLLPLDLIKSNSSLRTWYEVFCLKNDVELMWEKGQGEPIILRVGDIMLLKNLLLEKANFTVKSTTTSSEFVILCILAFT